MKFVTEPISSYELRASFDIFTNSQVIPAQVEWRLLYNFIRWVCYESSMNYKSNTNGIKHIQASIHDQLRRFHVDSIRLLWYATSPLFLSQIVVACRGD